MDLLRPLTATFSIFVGTGAEASPPELLLGTGPRGVTGVGAWVGSRDFGEMGDEQEAHGQSRTSCSRWLELTLQSQGLQCHSLPPSPMCPQPPGNPPLHFLQLLLPAQLQGTPPVPHWGAACVTHPPQGRWSALKLTKQNVKVEQCNSSSKSPGGKGSEQLLTTIGLESANSSPS